MVIILYAHQERSKIKCGIQYFSIGINTFSAGLVLELGNKGLIISHLLLISHLDQEFICFIRALSNSRFTKNYIISRRTLTINIVQISDCETLERGIGEGIQFESISRGAALKYVNRSGSPGTHVITVILHMSGRMTREPKAVTDVTLSALVHRDFEQNVHRIEPSELAFATTKIPDLLLRDIGLLTGSVCNQPLVLM